MTRSLLFAVALLVLPAQIHAETVEARFETANALLWNGDATASIAAYRELTDTFGVESPSVYYNLGTAYLRADQPGRAIWSYERALRLEPSGRLERDVRTNLERTRQLLTERYRRRANSHQLVFDEIRSPWERLTDAIGATNLRWGFTLSWALFCALFILRRWRSSPHLALTFALVCTGMAAVTSGALVAVTAWSGEKMVRGVVVESSAELRDASHPDAPTRPGAVAEGLEVRVVDTGKDGYVRVKLPNGIEGWLKRDEVEEI